jgi:hypothetical protein
MADGWYASGRSSFARGDIDWINDSVVAVLLDTSEYTVDLANDQYLADIPEAACVAVVELSGKSVLAGGVLDADDSSFAAVAPGGACGAVLLYKDTGAEASSPLVLYLDSLTGLPVTPDGGDIVATWNNGADRIAKL